VENMKNKKFLTTSFLALMILSFLSVANTVQIANAEVVNPDSVFYISPYVVLSGYQPEVSASVMTLSSIEYLIGLDDTYNDTQVPFSLAENTFFEQDLAPSDYLSDGITREFSSDIASKLDLSSGAGIYQTLQGISEEDFSQYDVDRDITTFTYTRDEAFNDTIVADLQDYDPDWNITHFDCRKAYIVFTLDKVLVDIFFAEAMSKDGYALISDEHSTDKQMITTLLDDVWPDFLLDLFYSTVNNTELETGITISEEIEAVLKTNSTDTSVNGTKRLVSMRNAAIGFIGEHIASQSTVELDSHPITADSPFFGFEQTSTTYTFNLDIKTDVCTGNTVDDAMTVAVGSMQLGDLIAGITSTVNIGWALFIGLGTAVLIGIITYLVRDGKNRALISVLVGLGVGLVAAFVYVAVAAFLSLAIV
jgi:hypothetical protein